MDLTKVSHWLERVSLPTARVGTEIGGGILILLLLLTVLNVILRFFFNKPFIGTYELTEFMIALVCLLSFAWATIKKTHVAVDLVVSLFPQGVQAVIATILHFVSLVLWSLITWRSFVYALTFYEAGEYSGALRIPIFPFVLLLSLGCGLLCLVQLGHFICSLNKTLEKNQWGRNLGLLLGAVLVLLIAVVFAWGKQIPVHLSLATVGIIGIFVLLLLIFCAMPIGFVMALVGFVGVAYVCGPSAALGMLGRVPYGTIASYTLCVVPLFMLMGQFTSHAGLSKDLYVTTYKWMGRLPGGLAMATVVACAGFGAISGSSIAAAATLSTVAYPQMRKYQYDPKLATASIAAGGPLSAMIPPSIVFIFYAICTEESIGQLFIAGIIPGLLIVGVFILTIYFSVRLNPLLGPPGPKANLREKLFSLKSTWLVWSLFLLVIGGIYTGIFTVVEAAGIGALGALTSSLLRRKLTWKAFRSSFLEVGSLTSMLFVIVIGAMIFGYFLTVTELPFTATDFVVGLPVPRIVSLMVILLLYLVLGTFMQTIAMILLTVPIFFPIIVELGYDPIWFGVIICLLCEIGLVTPPVGMTVYITAGVVKEVSPFTIFRGVIPFIIANLVIIAILIAFPQIAMFLPGLMKG